MLVQRITTSVSIALITTLITAASPKAATDASHVGAEVKSMAMPPSFANLVDTLTPAVVNISTTQKIKQKSILQGNPFGDLPNSPEFDQFRDLFEQFGKNFGGGAPNQERDVFSLGSGFIIDKTGYIITNNHVIDGAEEIDITLHDDTKYKAKLIGHDKKTDLALLKVTPEKDLPFVKMGDSDAMRVGDWVIAIGNPYGLGGSVTKGIISARQRSINAGPFDDFLQTDAPINRGNSGGPLFNVQGEVIGINTAIFSPSGGSIGIGFAIPTSLANNIIKQLKETGHTTRGWLGVKIQSVSEEIAESVGLPKDKGALVLEITENSPATKSDLQSGDIILSFDGKEVAAMRKLPRIVAETAINKKVDVVYWRAGKKRTTQITVGKLDEGDDASKGKKTKKTGKDDKAKTTDSEQIGGMRISPLTKQVREALNIDKNISGVAVSDVKQGSQASRKGIRRGDVISEVSGETVTDIASLKKAFANAVQKKRKFALVKILRGNDIAFITLPSKFESSQPKK